MALPARQTVGVAPKAQVTQPHTLHELQTGNDFFEYRLGNGTLLVGQVGEYAARGVGQEEQQLIDVHLGEVGNGFVCNTVTQRLPVEAFAVALRAFYRLALVRIGLFFLLLHILQHALVPIGVVVYDVVQLLGVGGGFFAYLA